MACFGLFWFGVLCTLSWCAVVVLLRLGFARCRQCWCGHVSVIPLHPGLVHLMVAASSAGCSNLQFFPETVYVQFPFMYWRQVPAPGGAEVGGLGWELLVPVGFGWYLPVLVLWLGSCPGCVWANVHAFPFWHCPCRNFVHTLRSRSSCDRGQLGPFVHAPNLEKWSTHGRVFGASCCCCIVVPLCGGWVYCACGVYGT